MQMTGKLLVLARVVRRYLASYYLLLLESDFLNPKSL
jgi:hypothetical protein